MPKNTDKLLEGYELRPEEQQRSAGFGHGKMPAVEGESYTVSDKPDRLVCSIFDKLESFEDNHPSTIGRLYMIISTLLVTLIFAIKSELLAEIPAMEVIFVSFLITFVFNYYLMNGALFKPFLDNDSNSFTIKLCGFYAVGAIACFFYGLTFIAVQTAVTIFYTSFFLAVLFDVIFLKENYKASELYFALGSLVGVVITIMGSSGELWSSVAPTEVNTMAGCALSAISAVFMALIMMNFGKMTSENFTSMAHIFTLMIVLFTPMFFPIQGVITPSMTQWGIMIGCGLLTAVATLFFIRSFQLESSSRSAVYLSLQVALIFLVEMILAKASGFGAVAGAVITIGCVYKYHQEFESKNLTRKSVAHQENGQELQEVRRSMN